MAHGISTRLTRGEGRKFAFTVGTAFIVLAGVTWWRDHRVLMMAFAAIGTTLGLAGLMVPGQLGPVYRAWMRFALLISKVTTPVFMSGIYILVLTPIGFVMRLLRRDPLARKASEGSYWVLRSQSAEHRSELTRQF